MLIDLHRHLEGSITPFVLSRLKRSLDCTWRPETEFFSIWPRIIGFIDTPELAEQIAYYSLEELARRRVAYAEYQISPAEFAISPATLVKSVRSGMLAARRDFGIPSNLIYNLTRHFPELIDRDVRAASDLYEAGHICAIGLAGNETGFPIRSLRTALSALQHRNTPLTFHAGEFTGASEVQAAIDLGVTRIGHGIRCIEDASVMSQIRDRGIGLEICITSEVALKNASELPDHPILKIAADGILFNINTDDPAVFDTEIDLEYEKIRDSVDIDLVNRNAMKMAFCDQSTKLEIIGKLA